MNLISVSAKGVAKINSIGAFCEILKNRLPDPSLPINELLHEFDRTIKATNANITRSALNKCHGDWYEWLLAIVAWNYHVAHPNSFVAINLPKISQFDVGKLYEEELYNLILDIKQKILDASSVKLTTSNPDFAIIDASKITLSKEFSQSINLWC